MHPISDIRLTGISRKNFDILSKLCGDDGLFNNVLIVSTMWDVTDLTDAKRRDRELKNNSNLNFKAAMEKGASMKKHRNTKRSARHIVKYFLNKQVEAHPSRKELEFEVGDWSTRAVRDRRDADHKESMGALYKVVRGAFKERDEEAKKTLDEERKKWEEKLNKVVANLEERSKQEKMRLEENTRKFEEEVARIRREGEDELKRGLELQRQLREASDNFEAERDRLQKQIDELKREGFFVKIGRAIDSLFVSSESD